MVDSECWIGCQGEQFAVTPPVQFGVPTSSLSLSLDTHSPRPGVTVAIACSNFGEEKIQMNNEKNK